MACCWDKTLRREPLTPNGLQHLVGLTSDLNGENGIGQVLIADLHGCSSFFGERPRLSNHGAQHLTNAGHLRGTGRQTRFTAALLGGNITLLSQEVDLALGKQLLFVAEQHTGFCPRDVCRCDDVDDTRNPQSLAHVDPSVHT